ncbi:MAG: hypothetical protein RBS55_04860 [Bacteroidales bacterium]|jgi:hypothetical protein|nr:hypothetical protein [Bacteroidales bacterium]
MASTSTIKEAIKNRVNGSKTVDYSIWTIGITTDPAVRKEQHGSPQYWTQWTADSLAVAREVETYFLNEYPEQASKRMKGGTGGDMSPYTTAYVYIF